MKPDFYGVWRFNHREDGTIITDGMVNPSRLHKNSDGAREEAKRLAEQNPSVVFTVCAIELMGEAVMNQVKWSFIVGGRRL